MICCLSNFDTSIFFEASRFDFCIMGLNFIVGCVCVWVIISQTHESNFAFRRTKNASYAIHKSLIMRRSILTVISLKMWSLHLLQTALRCGGNLKVVCGSCGDKFVEGDWSSEGVGRLLGICSYGSSVLWSWPLIDLLPEALTSLGKIWSFFPSMPSL